MTQNLMEKYSGYRRQGLSDQDAYQLTVDSIGEVSELIESIQLQQSQLEEAVQMNYSKQNLKASDFCSVTVNNGKFNYSDLSGSDSDLTKSEFKSSNLQKCTFDGENLTGTSFGNSTFKGASFSNCTFDQAVFKGCDLNGMDFDGEIFNQTIFETIALKKTSFAMLYSIMFIFD